MVIIGIFYSVFMLKLETVITAFRLKGSISFALIALLRHDLTVK